MFHLIAACTRIDLSLYATTTTTILFFYLNASTLNNTDTVRQPLLMQFWRTCHSVNYIHSGTSK